MKRVAILGASGFIGGRMVEMFHLDNPPGCESEVRPVVRTFKSLARLARFDLDCRLADALDGEALAAAFEGCEGVVHCVHGQLNLIEESIDPVYRAACKAGVRRLVYLSTASVHGQAPLPGTDESSPLGEHQEEEYNNHKVRAEKRLLKAREHGPVEIVILRPGIVFGPRSRWIATLADELLQGTAYLVGDNGICNSIYVDNVVHAVRLALTSPAASVDREAFLIGDRETVTWSDLYTRVARALGLPPEAIHRPAPPSPVRKNFAQQLDAFRGTGLAQSLLPLFPAPLKRAVKAGLAGWREEPAPSPWTLPGAPLPHITPEMAALHQCLYKLPSAKAARLLGYEPIVTFEEGCRRSVEWLGFAGYPLAGDPTDRG